jgi:hypothetical protein
MQQKHLVQYNSTEAEIQGMKQLVAGAEFCIHSDFEADSNRIDGHDMSLEKVDLQM